MTKKNIRSARGAKKNRGAVRVPTQIRKALADFDMIAKKCYGQPFEALALDAERRRATARMRQLVGVALKKDYSDGKKITTKSGALVDYKWTINDARLNKMPEDAWQFKILEMAPIRLKNETGKEIAARLRRETLLQRAYFGAIHPLLCQSPKFRKEIKAILKKYGLGDFVDRVTPKKILEWGAGALYDYLYAILSSHIPAAAIAVAAWALCVAGLNRICRGVRSA